MTTRAIAIVVLAASFLFGAIFYSGGLFGRSAGKKIKTLELRVAAAERSVRKNFAFKQVAGNCQLVWSDVNQIRTDFADSAAAQRAADAALEFCNYTLPVDYFSRRLGDTPCDGFVNDAESYFDGYRIFALRWWDGEGTAEQRRQLDAVRGRFKSAMAEPVAKACPRHAKAAGYALQ